MITRRNPPAAQQKVSDIMDKWKEYDRLQNEFDGMWKAVCAKVAAGKINFDELLQHPEVQSALDANKKIREFYDKHIRHSGGE